MLAQQRLGEHDRVHAGDDSVDDPADEPGKGPPASSNEDRPRQNETSGWSCDTDVNEDAAKPTGGTPATVAGADDQGEAGGTRCGRRPGRRLP
jgi:hypothetical protein